MGTIEIVIERDVMVPMRDGVFLVTDVYRPATEEPVPVLLLRTPYGKRDVPLVHTTILEPLAAVERGYAVVVQDTRGAWGASEGEFEPIFGERDDGHDAIGWIAAQSWCNGNVGIYGASFMGIMALQATVSAPDALKACIGYIAPASFHSNYWYSGGAFEVGARLNWSLSDVARRKVKVAERLDASVQAEIDETLDRYRADPHAFYSSSFDPSSLPGACDAIMPYFRKNLSHPSDDEEYWGDIDVVAAASQIKASVMYIAGWYDIFLKSGIELYKALRKESAEEVRDGHALVIGPWEHQSYLGGQTLSSSGIRNFGGTAASGQPALQSLALNWFDEWLTLSTDVSTRVRYFQIGENCWKEADNWPPGPVTKQNWYLHSGGQAQTRSGDGVLHQEVPGEQPPDGYVYDPADPAPTHGGRHLLFALPSGVQDQGVVEDRGDVLVYTSATLPEPISVLGNTSVELYVSSSAPTTDFIAVLSEVRPNGVAENVAEGIVRLSPEPDMAGNKIRQVSINLQDAAYTFPVGSRIRVHITSSCFPRFDRNRNVAPDEATNEATSIAAQQVHHNGSYPSALILECT